MSLIDAMMVDCSIINKTTTTDSEGGTITSWEESTGTIQCAIVLDTSITAKIAEANGFTNAYTVTTRKNVSLDYHDVIKRKSDGKTFRITSDGSDKVSPTASSLNMRQYSAENWSITE